MRRTRRLREEDVTAGAIWEPDGPRLPNPPTFDAPGIQDLEFGRRIDPTTGSIYIVRDASYRGDDAEFPRVRRSEDTYAMLNGMGVLPEENIAVLLLVEDPEDPDAWTVIGLKPTHKGHLDSVEASLRQIVTDALLSGRAGGLIFAHNHPSGFPGPSPDDQRLTAAVDRTASRLGIRLVDHLVIGRPADGREPYFSFRDAGLIPDRPVAEPAADPPPPPPISTDGLSDLEFIIDRDEESGSLMPTRDGDYRGDGAQKPVVDTPRELMDLFPEIGDDATVVVLLDTRQNVIGWTAWGDARGETPERLVWKAVLPPLMMNARSVALVRSTGDARPTRRDDALVAELAAIYGELDVELFDYVLSSADGRWYSYQDAGRLPGGDGA